MLLCNIAVITSTFTETPDLIETASEIKEIKLETTSIIEADSNKNIDNTKKEIQSTHKEETPGTEEIITNKKEIMPNKKPEIDNKEEIPNKEEVLPDKVISNEEGQNADNIETAEEKSVNLDDWIESDSNGIVLDEANMDDWIEGDGEDWN